MSLLRSMHEGPPELLNFLPAVHMSKSVFVEIMKAFSLPLAFLESLSKDAGQYARFHRQNPERMGITESFQLLWGSR